MNHVEAVTCFINTKSPNKLLIKQQLNLYILSQSYRKFWSRLASRIADRFYRIIVDLGDDDVGRHYSARRPHHPIFPTKTLLRALHKSRSWFTAENIRIPTLLELANDTRDVIPYTSIACIEFHRLLVAILKGYRLGLEKLEADLAVFKQTGGQLNGQELLTETTRLTMHIKHVSCYAAQLQLIVYASLMDIHLDILSTALYTVFQLRQWQSKSEPDPEDVDEDLGTNDELSDLCNSIESDASAVSQTFHQWLCLQVQHRVAVDRLLSHDFPRPISVEVIDSMNIGNTMEPWKTTIEDLASRFHLQGLEEITEALSQMMEKASSPPVFPGTLHCEAILAALMILKEYTPVVPNDVIQKTWVSFSFSSNLSTCI